MPSMRPPTRSFAALVLAAAALAGCGSAADSPNGTASMSPQEIVAEATKAAQAAATVHVAGSIVSARRPISLNMELVSQMGAEGTVTLGGSGVQLVQLERTLYLKGNGDFDRRVLGRDAARRLRGRWLQGATGSPALAPLARLCDARRLLARLLAGHGRLLRAGASTVDGRKATAVEDAAAGGTLYVASTGVPYPLELVKGGAHAGTVVFDRWNRPVTLTPPSNAVAVGELAGRR
jgi:hypothetical protein